MPECKKCKDGWTEDGNAGGHAGIAYLLCSCEKGVDNAIRAVIAMDPEVGEIIRKHVEYLRKEVEGLMDERLEYLEPDER